MDKNAVKKFAVNARRKLIDSVSQKAYGLGISKDEIKEVEQIPNGSRIKINNDYVYLTDIETEHRERLIDQIEYKGYEQVVEEVAYTWFNRIIAIRFMEVNDYLPTRVRVLSSEDENKVEPDAVTQALDLVEDLGLNTEKIYNYQDNNDIEGLFKYIFIKQCNALGKIMPVMFEKIEDYFVKDEYVSVPMYGLRKYILEKKGVEITADYDFIETNLDGTEEEYLIYHVKGN